MAVVAVGEYATESEVIRDGLPASLARDRASVVVVLELVAHGNNGDVRFILDLEQSDIA